jgi:hypothetical protein
MWAGRMWTRLRVGLALVLLAGPVGAETAPAACGDLVALVSGVVGDLVMPQHATQDGWCVLDGARSSGEVRVSAEALRVRGEMLDDRLVALEVEGEGLRVAPALNNRDMPGWLRDLLRLQSADVHLVLLRDDNRDAVMVQTSRLTLSGGSKFIVTGEVAGAELSKASVLTGRVTQLYLEWQNDGRTLRPVLEAWGERLQPGTTGTKAVLAARAALLGLVEAMPAGSLLDGMPEGVEGFIAALPQGRGRLMLMAGSDEGFGLAQLGLLALADDPTAPEALARAFKGTRISIAWTPGLDP